MAEQATSFVDRFDTARVRIDEEVQRVQKEIKTRRKRIEKQIASGRKSIEKQTRKQVRQIEADLKDNSVVQQLERVRDEATRQVETVFETILGALQIASKGDVSRIDRKLTKLNKKLKDIERTHKGNGQAPGRVAQV